MKLGIVTYNIAADWDLETIITNCEKLGLGGVELRTTHAHGVELELSAAERAEVKARFADSAVELVGLGSVYEFQSPDADELKSNIEGTKAYVELARDVGAGGVKVRPNFFPEGVPREATIEQIGRALGELAPYAAERGIELRLEVHGKETSHPPYCAQMIEIAGHPNAKACWNCNGTDLDESGSIDAHFEMISEHLGLVHLHDLTADYPYRRLIELLKGISYDGYCLAEIGGSSDGERVLAYFKALFQALGG